MLTPAGKARATPGLLRLMVNLQGYCFKVEYLAGRENVVADYLSRLPATSEEEEEGEEVEEGDLVAQIREKVNISMQEGDWRKVCQNDRQYQAIWNRVISGWHHKRNLTEEEKALFEVRDELSIVEDFVLRRNKIYPPVELRKGLVELSHAGHSGMVATRKKLREVYWWPGMDRMVERYVQGCVICDESDKTMRVSSQPMCPLSVPEGPWQRVGIDILGPYSDLEEEPVYFLVMVDHFTKWPEVQMEKKVTAKEVIAFMEGIFRREGYPREILSDNGPQFDCGEVRSFCKLNCVQWKFGSVYHPETNGQVERLNRVVTECIQLAVANNLKWRMVLEEMIFSYRVTPHVSSGVSPFRLMRGREPVTKLRPGWLLGLRKETVVELDVVKDKLKSTKDKMKVDFDKKKRRRFVDVSVGDDVKVKKDGIIKKGQSKYSERKRVVEVYAHSLRVEDGKIWNKNRVVRCKVGIEESAASGRKRCDRNVYDGEEGQEASVGNEQVLEQVVEEKEKAVEESVVEGVCSGDRPVRRRNLPERLKDYVMKNYSFRS